MLACNSWFSHCLRVLWLLVSTARGKTPPPRVTCDHFLLPEKNLSQPVFVNSSVSGSELNRPFPALFPLRPPLIVSFFYPVLPLCLCVQQLCKVAIKELN